jgi:hypothetical protein
MKMKKRILLLGIQIFLIILAVSPVFSKSAVGSSELNVSINDSQNSSVILILTDVSVKNFIPKEFKIGDVQFNIQILNNKNSTINNVMAFISGRGYSTYNVVEIPSLGAGEKDYVFVNGNFRESGNITLTIKIGNEIFYQNVSVYSNENIDLIAKELEKKAILANLSMQLKEMEEKYSQLDDEFSSKKENSYDVSQINLDELRRFLREARINIIEENIDATKKNLEFAESEYKYQKNKLDKSKKISFITQIKDNAILFSAIAGALIMFFTLSELLKKKGEGIVSSVGSIGKRVVSGKKRARKILERKKGLNNRKI